jgi:uncharacterized protein
MAVLLLHGWKGSGDGHWQRWLAAELEEAGADVRFPDLPRCERPCPDRWAAVLHAQLAGLGDGAHTVVCHSLGCVLWLREAPRVRRPVDRVLLVAPPTPACGVHELEAFYPDAPAVAAAARETRLVCSDDDPYAPDGAAARWGAPLGLPVDLLPGQGHLNVDAGYGPWPEVLDWVLGRAAYVGAKNGALT